MVIPQKKNALDRYYNIVKVLLTLSPFVGLSYIMMGATKNGTDIASAIAADPSLTVMFLVSMINPFIAYLLIFMHRRLNGGDVAYAVVNLILLVVAEAMIQNLLYIILLGFVLYKTMRTYDITIRKSLQLKLKDHFFSTISGSIVVLVLTGICLFAQIRIGMQ